MRNDAFRCLKAGLLVVALAATGVVGSASSARAADECLGVVESQTDGVLSGDDSLCGTAGADKKCTFQLRLCLNKTEAGCAAGDFKTKTVKAKGKCKAGKVKVKGSGTTSPCGAFVGVSVKTKKKGTVEGTCLLKVKAKSKDKPARTDLDMITLSCKPATSPCPTTTTTTVGSTSTTEATTTTTTLPCGNGTVDGGEECDPAATPTGCGAGETCAANCTCATCPSPCAPTQIVTQTGAGTLVVATLAAFPFPPGVQTTIDIGTADGTCRHDAIVPAGGFSVPVFCIPALGYTSQVIVRHCEAGGADGNGAVWDAAAPCSDADVSRVGDTSDASTNNCGTLGTGCVTAAGGAGNDTGGNIDTTRGDSVCDAAGVHTQLSIPVRSLTWQDNDAEPDCPDEDGVFDEGTDLPITDFNFILSPTTATTNSQFVDLNGDGCSKGGAGPQQLKRCSNDHAKPCGVMADCPGGTCENGSLQGSPATGPCCVVGQQTTVVASGVAFTGGGPLYDLIFANASPTTITACNAPAALGSCTLTTNACQD